MEPQLALRAALRIQQQAEEEVTGNGRGDSTEGSVIKPANV